MSANFGAKRLFAGKTAAETFQLLVQQLANERLSPLMFIQNDECQLSVSCGTGKTFDCRTASLMESFLANFALAESQRVTFLHEFVPQSFSRSLKK